MLLALDVFHVVYLLTGSITYQAVSMQLVRRNVGCGSQALNLNKLRKNIEIRR